MTTASRISPHRQGATPHHGQVASRRHRAQTDFLADHPDFDADDLARMRAAEYGRIDATGQLYLDYTGAGLHADSQLRAHLDDVAASVFGNPHSISPTSHASTERVERTRDAIRRHFNAPPDEYAVIFTANASGALRLVGEAYPFAPGGRFVVALDNHNSVNGIREFARARGAHTTYLPLTAPTLRLDDVVLHHHLKRPASDSGNLIAYPAQSNFSGVQHPLEWIGAAHERGWDVLLDAAAFVPTNELDLERWRPDFVPISFYKMFGYPTGVGCLLARRSALSKLVRPWFAGGTIWAVNLRGERHFMAAGEAAFEDGTVNFLSIPAVETGLRHLNSVGLDRIHRRVLALTDWLLRQLDAVTHANGNPVVRLYGPRDCVRRGATIALNFLTPAGHIVDERIVDRRAAEARISLRTGCFCNPGTGEAAFGIAADALTAALGSQGPRSYEEYLAALGMESGGAVRVSLGIATTFDDVYRFMEFVETFVDQSPVASDLAPRDHC